MVIEKSAFLGGDTFNFGKFFFSPGFILMGHTFFKCQNPGTPNLAKWSINDMRSKTIKTLLSSSKTQNLTKLTFFLDHPVDLMIFMVVRNVSGIFVLPVLVKQTLIISLIDYTCGYQFYNSKKKMVWNTIRVISM